MGPTRVASAHTGEAFRGVGEGSRAGRHGQAALSGSKPKAPGSAGGYLHVDALITLWDSVETVLRYKAAEIEHELERRADEGRNDKAKPRGRS